MRKFTPKDYLSYIKYILANKTVHDYSTGSQEYKHITEKNMGDEYKNYSNDELVSLKPLEDTLNNIFTNFLDYEESKKFKEQIALGILLSDDLSASIYKAHNGHIAIIYNHALIEVMKTHLSFMIAVNMPENVQYTSLGNVENISSTEYMTEHQAFLEDIMNNGKPTQTIAKFKFSGIAKMILTYEMYTFDFFIIGHELGHFFNGDLDDDNVFKTYTQEANFSKYTNNVSHRQEFIADIYGIKICKKIFPKINFGFNFNLSIEHILKSTIDFFYLVSIINPTSTKSHPNPKDRASALIDEFLGIDYDGFLRNKLKYFQL